jgi:hypothetical protein
MKIALFTCKFKTVKNKISFKVEVTSIFAGISWPEQITVQWDDNDVHFVLDQHDVFL